MEVRKGDTVKLRDSRTGKIVKYLSNKAIHLDTGVICSKEQIIEILSPSPPPPLKIPINGNLITINPKTNTYHFNRNNETLAIDFIGAKYSTNGNLEWSVIKEPVNNNGKVWKNSGYENWKAFEYEVLMRLKKGITPEIFDLLIQAGTNTGVLDGIKIKKFNIRQS